MNAHEQGRKAAECGILRQGNPYSRVSEFNRYYTWSIGWYQGYVQRWERTETECDGACRLYTTFKVRKAACDNVNPYADYHANIFDAGWRNAIRWAWNLDAGIIQCHTYDNCVGCPREIVHDVL